MTQDANIQLLVARLGAEFKAVKQIIAGNDSGDLSALSTADQSNIVASINEIFDLIGALTSGGVQFRGTVDAPASLTGTSTGNTYIDAGNGYQIGDLFKVGTAGTLTLADGTVEVGALDSFYVLRTTGGAGLAIADIAAVDSTEAVTSVAGKVGNVSLDTDDVTEAGNLYFTDARVLATALTGLTAAPGVVTAADGLLSALNKIVGNQGQLRSDLDTLTAAYAQTATDLGPLDTDYVQLFDAALL